MPRRWTLRIAAMAGAMIATTILSGCSGSGLSPDAGSTATQPAQTGSAAPQPQTMASRDDLISPRALAWDSWREQTPTTIELSFLAGPAACTGIHVDITETAEDVTIDLTEGSLPGSTDCKAIALATTTTVDLAQPLNDRQVRQSAG